MQKLILPYFPYFSNCRGYDSYIPIYAALESDQCDLPEEDEEYPASWYRRGWPALPHVDDVTFVSPITVGIQPVADSCYRTIYCQYEEDLPNRDAAPRWMELESGTTAFHFMRDPVSFLDYAGRWWCV